MTGEAVLDSGGVIVPSTAPRKGDEVLARWDGGKLHGQVLFWHPGRRYLSITAASSGPSRCAPRAREHRARPTRSRRARTRHSGARGPPPDDEPPDVDHAGGGS